MILRKFDVELHSLDQKDLELVRTWRNDNYVRQRMLFQEEISEQDQLKWFRSLDKSMIYLVIVHADTKIGLINVRKIDWKGRTGEAGIIIGLEKYRNSIIPMLAVYTLMDVFFEQFEFIELNACVRKNNEQALEFNINLGYRISEEFDDYYLLSVSKEVYRENRKRMGQILSRLDVAGRSSTFSEEERLTCFL